MKKIYYYFFDIMVIINVVLFPLMSVKIDVEKAMEVLHPIVFAIIFCVFMFFFFRHIKFLFETYQKFFQNKYILVSIAILIMFIFGSLIITIPYVFTHHPSFSKIYRLSEDIVFLAYIFGFFFAFFGFIEGSGSLSHTATQTKKISLNDNFFAVLKLILFIFIPWLIFSGYLSYVVSTLIKIPVINVVLAIIVFFALFALILYLSVLLNNSKIISFVEKTKPLRQFGENVILLITLNLWDNVFYEAYKETFGLLGLILTGLLPLRVMMMFSPSKKGVEFITGFVVLVLYIIRFIISSQIVQ